MLHSMFSGVGFKVERDEDGAYFIDRDGAHFRHIINFLRTGKAYIPDDELELTELLDELDFYQITSYERVLRDATMVECAFVSLGDASGILHWLGTQGRSDTAWRNPVTTGIVKVAHGGGNLIGDPAVIAERIPTSIVIHKMHVTHACTHYAHSMHAHICAYVHAHTARTAHSLQFWHL